jgi:hypothetical protein
MVATALKYLTRNADARNLGIVADVGCGKLRHFYALRSHAAELVLVDTAAQIEALHVDGKHLYTISSFVAAHQGTRHHAMVVNAHDFEVTRLDLDVAFCVAVWDVVPSRIRSTILSSIIRNLRSQAAFVLIVPRNDSSILCRCGPQNHRWDGYWFPNRNGFTFYRNFRDIRGLIASVERRGMRLEADLSRYRHVCLIFRKR